eukprot:scaffold19105_cov21-Cyclotella_meneghiniana.AAC.1
MSNNNAHRFLSRYEGFDSAKLSQRTDELQRRFGLVSSVEEEKKDGCEFKSAASTMNNYTSSATQPASSAASANTDIAQLVRSSTSLSALLASHHELCLRSAVEDAQRLEAIRSERREEDRAAMDWKYQREGLLTNSGDYGGRFMNGALISVQARNDGSSIINTNIVPKPQIVTQTMLDQLSFHSQGVDGYLKSTSSSSSSLRDDDNLMAVTRLIASLRGGIDEYSTRNSGSGANNEGGNNFSLESMHQYSNGLSLLESIVSGCDVSGGDSANNNQRLNTTNFGTNHVNNNNNNNTPRSDYNTAQHISSACRFFAHQFQTHMIDVVREVQLSGNTITTAATNENLTSLARDATVFAEIVLGQPMMLSSNNSSSTATANTNSTVWGTLFYCLRCGDLVAAQSVLSLPNTRDIVDVAVVDLVNHLADMQGKSSDTIFASSKSDNSTSGGSGSFNSNYSTLLSPSNAVTKARRVVGDLYEGIKNRFTASSLSSSSPSEQLTAGYQAACLAMLSGNESISEASILESTGLVKTVEDYLYASLWHALHLAQETSSSTDGVGLKHTCEAVARLGTLVKEWGPSYFEQEDDTTDGTAVSMVAASSQIRSGARDKIPQSGGWAYALPLLACQQY